MSTLSRKAFKLSLFCSCLIAQACSSSSDEPNPAQPLPDSGAETSQDADAQADAQAEASPDGGNEAAVDAPAPDAAAHRFALLVGSDYATKAETCVVDLDSNALKGRLSSDDQDTIATANAGRGFLLHRTQGKVTVLDPINPSVAKAVLDVSPQAEGGKANPYAVVVNAATEGYVIRYGQNSVPVVALESGAVQATVDLSGFVSDPDGLVDAFDGTYDASTGRIYVGLQRIDQNEYGPAPDYVGTCKTKPALIVGIDVATHQLVDLNGAADGLGIEVMAANPNAMVWDEASRSIMLLGVGCSEPAADGGSDRVGRGVERVMIDSAQTSWLWQTAQLDRPGALIWMSAQSAIVGLDDASFVRHWWLWDPTTTSLTQELQSMPFAPVFDGTSGLIGLQASTGDAGSALDVVRYDVASQTSTVLLAGAFSTPGLNAYSSAVVR